MQRPSCSLSTCRAATVLALLLARTPALDPDRGALPPMPTFSASAAMHRLALAEFPGYSAEPYFRSLTFAHDADAGRSEARLVYKNFAFVGSGFEFLATRQVCTGGRCMTSDRNGSWCYEGGFANLQTLDALLPRLASNGSYAAPGQVDGQACETWRMGAPSVGNLSACVRRDGVPLSLVAEPSSGAVGLSNVGSYSQNLTFHGILTGAEAVEAAIEPLACPSSERSACASAGVESFQVLRASDGEPWGHLEDRDTFDWGGVGVTLGAPGFESFIRKKHLEVADVDADTAFGPWRECDYNREKKEDECAPMPPGMERLVSRTSAEHLTGEANAPGQCGANELVGSWLVFPSEGRCAEGASVGEGGCTWRARGVKVVAMDCVRSFDSDGWARAWAQDYQKAPFPNVVRAVRAAVEGCPDVRSPLLP